MRRPSLPRLRRGAAKPKASPRSPAAPAPAAKPKKASRRAPPLKLIVPGAVAILVVVLLLATCGTDDDKEVRGTLEHFAQASRDKDYQALCDDLLSSTLVAQLRTADRPCEVVLRIALGDVQNPTLEVRSVKIDGDKATAEVHTTAAGQQPADAKIRLLREGDGWRISVLPNPQNPAAGP